MDSKLLARIGAAVFVGIAVAITLVQMREEPVARQDPVREVWLPDGDPLAAQLRACAEMGELALSHPDCRAAWAEKRRRFFGVNLPGANSSPDESAPPPMKALPAPEQRGED